jgi:hypothetical protein
MKKKIFSIVFIAAIAVAAAWNFSRNQDEVELSDLDLSNVEALAGCEMNAGSGNVGVCAPLVGGGSGCVYGTGSPVCSGNIQYVK